jgi:subtilisin family serine protease
MTKLMQPSTPIQSKHQWDIRDQLNSSALLTPDSIKAKQSIPTRLKYTLHLKRRVDRLKSLWIKDDARDPVGHGTHVRGSILGSGFYVDSSTGTKVSVKGTAPAARLMVQGLSKWLNSSNRWMLVAPADITALFEEPYSIGIRIHSNSWGDSWDVKVGQLGYDTDATAIDRYVRGDKNVSGHQDFVVHIAAGNDADKETTVTVRSAAIARRRIVLQ